MPYRHHCCRVVCWPPTLSVSAVDWCSDGVLQLYAAVMTPSEDTTIVVIHVVVPTDPAGFLIALLHELSNDDGDVYPILKQLLTVVSL